MEKHKDQNPDNLEKRAGEIRASKEGDRVIEGYAAVFNVITEIYGFREKIAPGAFDDCLGDDVRLLLNHEGAPFARTAAGTMKISVDDHGLKYRAELADTQAGEDLYKMIARGDISQSSFQFAIDTDEWRRSDDEAPLRTIVKVAKLYDCAPVTFPAYNTASVVARSKAAEMQLPEPPPTPPAPVPAPDKSKSQRSTKFEPSNPHSMNVHDLKALRATKFEEHKAILEDAESEGRELTDSQIAVANDLEAETVRLSRKIAAKEQALRMAASMAHSGVATKSEGREIDKMNSQFSIMDAVRSVQSGRALEGVAGEWLAEGQKEARLSGIGFSGNIAIPNIALRAGTQDNFEAGGTGDGSGFVGVDVPGFIEALRSPTIIEQIGTQVLNGATNNIKLPRVSQKATANVALEGVAIAASTMQLDEVTLSAKIAGADLNVTNLLLHQGTSVDSLIASDLGAAIRAHIDKTAFAAILADSAVDNQSTAGATDTEFAAIHAVAMEAAVLAAGGNLEAARYIMSPTAYKLAKTLAMVTAVNPLYDLPTGKFNGYAATPTEYVLDETAGTVGQLIFGNFAQGALLAKFGPMQFRVDPYSAGNTDEVILRAICYYDFAIRQPGAFSVMNDVVAPT
jgi:HK97 family phage prohead protease/HK97 family phage major capsid protein